MKKILLLALLPFIICKVVVAQDASYQNFAHNRFLFNPSLTGTSGSESWKLRTKAQWLNDGGQGYKTHSILFEETMPCSIIDIGAKLNYNEEGAGRYRTYEVGFLSSAFVPLPTKFHDHNFRGGVDFSWGVNSIDYARLIWSDQLHPKYGFVNKDGVPNPTTFVPPNDGWSNNYLNPGIGFSWRAMWFKKSKKAIMTNIGWAAYRFVSISDGEIGQSVSVLGLNNSNPTRCSYFVESEFVPVYYGRQYVSVRPSIVVQSQGPIRYAEMGTRLGYSRHAGIGFYYHTANKLAGAQTQWVTMSTDFSIALSRARKMDILLSYSSNIGGLKNFVGPQFELGLTYHIAQSSICNLMDQEDDVPYNHAYICPIMMVSPGKRKMYENIWNKE